jgi:hypothetical protein
MSDKLAELYVEITARTDKLKAELAKAEKVTADSGKKMQDSLSGATAGKGISPGVMAGIAAVGLVVAGAFAEMVKNTIALGHELTIMSKRTGLSTDFLQAMGYAAEMTGGKLKDVEQISQRLTLTIAKAGEGQKAAIKSLADVGLSYDMLKDKKPEEQWRMIFEAINKIPDPLARALATQELLGSADFLPLIEQYKQLEEQQKKLGSMTPEQIAAVESTAIQIKKLEVAWKGLSDQLALTVIPNLGPLASDITALLTAITALAVEWNKLDPKLKVLLGGGGTPWNAALMMLGYPAGSSINWAGAKAEGGIVSKPSLAMVGEAGPEAIIPLSQMGGMGGGLTVNVGSFMGDEISLREFTRRIQRIFNEESRRSSFKPTETSYYSVGGHL